MCLRNKIDKTELQEFKNTIPKDGLVVYKIVGIGRGDFFPVHINTREPYKVGLEEADTSHEIELYDDESLYRSGFHFYVEMKDAKNDLLHIRGMLKDDLAWMRKHARQLKKQLRKNYTIIECVVKKSWITNKGKDGCRYLKTFDTVVAKKAIFPKFSRKKYEKSYN